MLEFQSQYPAQPEPVFPNLIPLEQDLPEDYDPDTQDNTGHFPDVNEQHEGNDVGYDTAPFGIARYNALMELTSDLIVFDGQGNKPKPQNKIRGSQFPKREEKIKPKLIIRNPFVQKTIKKPN